MTTFHVNMITGITGEEIEHSISAEYFRHDDGWVSFKDSKHKVIADFPEARIVSITAAAVERSTEIPAADKISAINDLLASFTSFEPGSNIDDEWFTINDHLFLDTEFWHPLIKILRG